jgi:hypothetical protein
LSFHFPPLHITFTSITAPRHRHFALSALLKAFFMKGTLFLKAVRHLLDPIDKKAPRKTWDIAFCTLKGKKVTGKVACTSSNFENDTFNFKFIESNEIRTAHAQLLLSVNGKEVML